MATVAKLKVITTVSEIQSIVENLKRQGKSVGLVPTMGSLHEGHISLIRASVKENDCTVVTIFVNPTQFGPNEDFDRYPRNLKTDTEICQREHVQYIFAPSNTEMYSNKEDTYYVIPPEKYTSILCGKHRPGHFEGVATVVTKLFNIIPAQKAYFGQKDAQQLFIIKKLAKQLNIAIEIITCPIVREADNLAMSSRNLNLTEKQRTIAPKLFEALNSIKQGYSSGNKDFETLANIAKNEILDQYKQIRLEYLQAYDYENLQQIHTLKPDTLIAIAAKLGEVRLIDNIIIE